MCRSKQLYSITSSAHATVRRIDNNPFANDAASDQLEFELIIFGQRLAGLRRQQLDTTLNI